MSEINILHAYARIANTASETTFLSKYGHELVKETSQNVQEYWVDLDLNYEALDVLELLNL